MHLGDLIHRDLSEVVRELHRPLWKRGRAPGVGSFRSEESERRGFALSARRGALGGKANPP